MPQENQPLELSVIIVNWNSKEYLRQCLNSLHHHCPDVKFEVIVIDGASFDGCGEMLAKEFPSVSFIQSEKNVGFAKANNLGARRARGKYLLLLNPDTEFRENSPRIMLDHFARLPQAGLLGCKLLNADGSLQTTSVLTYPTILNQVLDSEFLRRKFRNLPLWGVASIYTEPPRPAEVEVISGACILISRALYAQVGGFSEDFFMYSEDVDLGWKVRQAGHPAYYLPFTSVIHYGGSSSDQASGNFSSIMMRESTHRFLCLRRGPIYAALFRTILAATTLIRLIWICVLLPIPRNGVVQHGQSSLRKWWSVFRWSIGLERWARSFPNKS